MIPQRGIVPSMSDIGLVILEINVMPTNTEWLILIRKTHLSRLIRIYNEKETMLKKFTNHIFKLFII